MNNNICPLCGGDFHNDIVIFTANLKPGILIIKDVPAKVCNHCGYESIDYDTTIIIEKIAESSRNKNAEVEILKFNAA